MVVIVCLLLGGAFGAWRANKRGGTKLDVAQYAAVYAIIFALVALFATIIFSR